MQADKDEEKLLRQALDEWQSGGVITLEQADAMRHSIVSRTTERQQLAQYFFIIAVSSALLAFGALFLDEKLLEHLRRAFLLSNYTISFVAALLAGGSFWHASRRQHAISDTMYEVYLIPGVLCTGVSLVYLCKEVGNGASYTFFTGLCSIVFLALSVAFRSRMLWVSYLASLIGWFAAFSTVHSRENLFWDMNYPVRFTVFGLLLLLLSVLQQHIERLRSVCMLTYLAGLLIFFAGLWGISVFGNFGSFAA